MRDSLDLMACLSSHVAKSNAEHSGTATPANGFERNSRRKRMREREGYKYRQRAAAPTGC